MISVTFGLDNLQKSVGCKKPALFCVFFEDGYVIIVIYESVRQ